MSAAWDEQLSRLSAQVDAIARNCDALRHETHPPAEPDAPSDELVDA
jgi:hypothetical protein